MRSRSGVWLVLLAGCTPSGPALVDAGMDAGGLADAAQDAVVADAAQEDAGEDPIDGSLDAAVDAPSAEPDGGTDASADRWTVVGSGRIFESIWGRAADDVYVVSEFELLHLGPSGVLEPVAGAPTTSALVFGWGSDLVVVTAGFGVAHRRTDGTWVEIAAGTAITPRSVFGVSLDDFWVGGRSTGDFGYVIHCVARSCTAPQRLFGPVDAIWGAAANDVWLMSVTPFRWNGVTIAESMLEPYPSAASMWGFAADEVFAGDRRMYQFDGTAWVVDWSSDSVGASFTSMHGTSPADLWAGDRGYGRIWSRDATGAWTYEDLGREVRAVWTHPDAVYVGTLGTLLRLSR